MNPKIATAVFVATVALAPQFQIRDAAAAGSHNMATMCAKANWTYRPKTATSTNNSNNVSKTSNEHCSGNYRQSHDDTQEKTTARREACDAAKAEAPKLTQGDQWIIAPTCNFYEKSMGG